MNGLVKLLPDVPVEIALSSTDGINVVSPRGTPAVKYTLVDGRTFFATQYVVAKFKKLRIEACERIALCMRNIDGKSITLVERVPEPNQDTSTEPIVSTDAPPASDLTPPTAPQEDTCSTPTACDDTSQDDDSGKPDPELLSELTLATANGCASDHPTRESPQDCDSGLPLRRAVRQGDWLPGSLRSGIGQVHGGYGADRHAGR